MYRKLLLSDKLVIGRIMYKLFNDVILFNFRKKRKELSVVNVDSEKFPVNYMPAVKFICSG